MSSNPEKKFWTIENGTITIQLKAKPKSRRLGFHGVLTGPQPRLIWGVASAPEGGKANHELVHSLARSLRIPVKAVKITLGETSPLKTIKINASEGEEIVGLLASFEKND